MKKLKKILISLFMVLILSFSLTACGNNDEKNSNENNSNIEQGTGNENGDGNTDDNTKDDDGNDGSEDDSGKTDDGNEDNNTDDGKKDDSENDDTGNLDDENVSMTVSEFLTEILNLNHSLSNYYTVSISEKTLVSEKNYSEIVNVITSENYDEDGTTTINIMLSMDNEIVSYVSETISVSKENIKTISGIVLDEQNKYYSYIDELSVSDSSQSDYTTLSQYLYVQNSLLTYDNEFIYNLAFLENYESTFGVYVNVLSITKNIEDNKTTYVLTFENESSNECELKLVFESDDLTSIQFSTIQQDSTISMTFESDESKTEVVLPSHTDGTYIQENKVSV